MNASTETPPKPPEIVTVAELFEQLGGDDVLREGIPGIYPVIDTRVESLAGGVQYIRKPGAALIGQPFMCAEALRGFTGSFPMPLEFDGYVDDFTHVPENIEGPLLAKVAGQLCYLSFGPQRSWNAELDKYIDHIKSVGHGSVLEHANYTVLLWGISRSLTHELVRHRVGVAYSQVSQRYVDGSKLRFVMRPEYDGRPKLEKRFFNWIEAASDEYDARAADMAEVLADDPAFQRATKTERRKMVNQTSRACLPNETEAPIIVTVNARTMRHLSEMRVAGPAEPEIRRAMLNVFLCISRVAGAFFSDYKLTKLPDGTYAAQTDWRRV